MVSLAGVRPLAYACMRRDGLTSLALNYQKPYNNAPKEAAVPLLASLAGEATPSALALRTRRAIASAPLGA